MLDAIRISPAVKKGKQYPWWIKERHNPQIGTYYVACGQMSKTAAKKTESSLYGINYMLRFDTKSEYQKRLDELRKDGERVQ